MLVYTKESNAIKFGKMNSDGTFLYHFRVRHNTKTTDIHYSYVLDNMHDAFKLLKMLYDTNDLSSSNILSFLVKQGFSEVAA